MRSRSSTAPAVVLAAEAWGRGACSWRYLREAEIENLGVAARGDEKIRRLDVAMNDAFRVRRIERIGDFNGQRDGVFDLDGAAIDAVLERLPVEKFHGDERASAIFGNFVDGADVGMIQGRGGASFAAETFEGLRVLGDVVRQEFQRDEAAERNILGFIDNAHPPTAELFDDAEMRDGLANQRVGTGQGADILCASEYQVNAAAA